MTRARAQADAALSDVALQDRAGASVWQRGLAYFHEGRMRPRGEGVFDARGSAGAEYRVQLQLHRSEGLLAGCSCTYAAGHDFCKHMVAAALAWRAQRGGTAPPPAAPVPTKPRSAQAEKAQQTRQARRQALRAFLGRQSAEVLADRLWAAAEADRELMADLNHWAATQQAGSDPAALRRAIDAVLPLPRQVMFEGRSVRAWAERAYGAVALLQQHLPVDPAAVRELAEHALRRCFKVSLRADDSNGDIGGVMQALIELMRDAVVKAPVPPAWGQRLLALVIDDPFGLVSVPQFLDAAGAAAAQVYSRALAAAWRDHKPRPRTHTRTRAASWDRGEVDAARRRLRGLMLEDLERHGDVEALLTFQRDTSEDVFEHAELIRAYEAHGRHRQAIEAAREACRRFDNDPYIEDLLLEAYRRDGWDAEVLAIRWRRFQEQPSLQGYADLLAAVKAAREDATSWRTKAYAAVVAGETRKRLRDTSLRAAMLLYDGDVDAAYDIVQPPNHCWPEVLLRVAEALPARRKAQAFALVERVFEGEMRIASGPYTVPLQRVRQALLLLPAAQQRAWLAKLREEHKARRNFIAGLPDVAAA